MPVSIRPRAALLAGAATGLCLLQPPAQAGCVAHDLTVLPSHAAAGSLVTVRGRAWFVGCNDTGQGTPEPADTASLSVEQHGRVFHVGTATADRQYNFSKVVRLPRALRSGPATVIGDGKGGEARVTIEVTTGGELPLTGGGSNGAAAALAALGLALALLKTRQRAVD